MSPVKKKVDSQGENEEEVTVYTQSEIMNMISKDTHIHPEIVKIVMSRYQDICFEILCNNGKITWPRFFQMTSVSRERKRSIKPLKGTIFDYVNKTYNAEIESGRFDHKIHSVKMRTLSSLNELVKLQQGMFSDRPFLINRDTWRGALTWHIKMQREDQALEKLRIFEKTGLTPSEYYLPQRYVNEDGTPKEGIDSNFARGAKLPTEPLPPRNGYYNGHGSYDYLEDETK